jgi:hypothetical protein
MAERLEFDGQQVTWFHADGSQEVFAATSGLPGNQTPVEQCVPDAGPIPEGEYYLSLRVDPRDHARDDGTRRCNLSPSKYIQRIPRGGGVVNPPKGAEAGECETYWAAWGWNRVRLEPANPATTKRCTPGRGGFYLHDSTKGYTHGCIEVDGAFFSTLRAFVRRTKKQRLPLKVEYKHATTYGGTRR